MTEDDHTRNPLDVWLPAFLDGRRGPADLYAEDVHTWHAATDAVTPIDRDADDPSFARLRRVVPDLRRGETTVGRTPTGWVLQTSLVGTVDGEEVRAHVCLVVHLDAEGRIARFDEYADREQTAPFIAALTAPH